MALTPDVSFPTIFTREPLPSKTYRLDIETGVVSKVIDGEEAIRQFITKAILTVRYAFTIYSDDYGCEIRSLLGKGLSDHFVRSEIKRMIIDALIYDDRIERVYDFSFLLTDDELYINFSVDTVEGTFAIKEVI
ncbi:DUF2634 domain-containing protein [Sporosarcina sp. Marseille-Q4943]|uniref:DUF2634 domain-containing protein n=1 Tax=Sporosarcina sp. Marseille-Q4943 TaxID=2942204 RepID=UPI00208DBD8A|nr:DUF2634 domain-containing protein [Sporosarcina sp. Marseille-Q4943]